MALDIVGAGGAATLPSGLAADLDGWSATVNIDTAVYSTFASQWKKSKITNGQVTGSVTGVVQYNAASTIPVPLATSTATAGTALNSFSGAATLTATTGCTINGTFNFSRVALSRQDKNQMTFSADIESDGEVLITWDVTSS